MLTFVIEQKLKLTEGAEIIYSLNKLYKRIPAGGFQGDLKQKWCRAENIHCLDMPINVKNREMH